MWKSFNGSLILLLFKPAFCVTKGYNVRTQGAEMGINRQTLQTDVVQAEDTQGVSVGADGKVSGVISAWQQKVATVNCKNIAILEGCMCENRPIGKGITGNFVDDTVKFKDFKTVMMETTNSFWDYTAYQYGEEVEMKKFKGSSKLTLVANVASACGLSNAFYKGASELLTKYGSKGFQLIAVPSSQFGQQAPHSSACERAYMYKKMHMDPDAFPVLDKVDVNGEHTAPFYRFLKSKNSTAVGGMLDPIKQARGEFPPGDLSWNYEKFFVNAKGEVVGRFSHAKDVLEIEEWIKGQL